MRTYFPKQRLSYKEKKKDNFKWAKDFADSIIRYHDQDFCEDCPQNENDKKSPWQHRRIKNMLSNYRLYNNQIDQSDFIEYCDSLGIKESLNVKINEIKPYNKTYNKINVLLGEEFKRPDNQRVILVNAEGIKSKLDYKNQLYQEYIQYTLQKVAFEAKSQFPELAPESFQSEEEYQQAMQEQEQAIQQKVDSIMEPAEIEKYMKTKYLHQKEILAGDLLNYLLHKELIKEKKNDGFKHGLISGEEGVWVGIVNGEPVLEVLNPLKMFYHKSSEVKYIQDGMYAGYRTHMTINDVLDRFADDLTDDEKEKLEDRYSSQIQNGDENLISKSMKYGDQRTIEYKYSENGFPDGIGSYGGTAYDDIEVIHLEWVSQRRVGFLSYFDENLEINVTKHLDESYTPPADAVKFEREEKGIKVRGFKWFDDLLQTEVELEWDWIPEVWETTRIDTDIFCNTRPKPNQHYSLDNPYKVKLGYHGVVYNNMNAPSQSIMDRMKPYQYLFFIAMDKFKKHLALDKGQIVGIDSSRLDPKFPIEKTIHFLEEAGYYVYNGLQNADMPGSAQRPGIDSINASNLQHLINFAEILAYFDEQISDAAGVTRQREGASSPYETATNNQQSIVQSSHITETTFMVHEQLWKEVKQSLIEVAEVAYKEKPLTTQYVLNDGSRLILEIDSDFFNNASFGIFVSDNAKEDQVFEELRSLVQPMIQSDRVMIRDIINILTADSLQELKRELISSEDTRIQREQEQAQQQQQHEKEMQEQMLQAQEAERQHQINIEAMKGEIVIAKAEIDSKRFMLAQDVNENGEPDRLEIEKLKLAEKEEEDTVKENEKDRRHESIENEKDRQVEREKIAAQKQIAKSRPKPAR